MSNISLSADTSSHPTSSSATPLPELPSALWDKICLLLTTDDALAMHSATVHPKFSALSHRPLLQAVQSLTPTNLAQINEYDASTTTLHSVEDRLIDLPKDIETQAKMARTARLSPAMQRFLAKCEHLKVYTEQLAIKKALGSNPNLTDPEARQTLAHDEYWGGVKAALARNVSLTDPQDQRVFCNSKEPFVRAAAAANPSLTDPALQRQLADDPSADVRESLIDNPSFSDPQAQRSLASDRFSRYFYRDIEVRIKLARSPRFTDTEAHKILANDWQRILREGLAGNANLTDLEIQQKLATDKSRFVRAALAANPSVTDTKIHRLLASDNAPGVRRSLANNPSLTDINAKRRLKFEWLRDRLHIRPTAKEWTPDDM